MTAPSTRALRGFLLRAGALSAAAFAAFGALTSVILPMLVAEIDPVGRVASLAAVLAVSSAVTLISQPLVGALSDRTRSRIGRRTPWVLVGAVVGAAFLFALGQAASIVWLAVCWSVIQFALNGADAAIGGAVVDRVPPRRRGTAFAVLGAASLTGGAIGVLVAGWLPAAPTGVAVVLGVLVLLAAAGYAIRRPDDEASVPVAPFALGAFLRGFWVDPRRAPDFAWLFAARFAFVIASHAIYGYLLYILIDHGGLSPTAAAPVVGVLTAVGAALMVAAMTLSGWLSDRLGRRKPFFWLACALLVVGLVALLVLPGVAGAAVYAVLHSMGSGIFLAVGSAAVSQVLPDPVRAAARDLGVYNVATNAAQIIAPLLAAIAITTLGGYPVLFGIALVLVVATALLIVPLGRRSGALR